jgi:hypothetical protein
MRLVSFLGIAVLAGLVTACQTTGDDADVAAVGTPVDGAGGAGDTAGGGLGGLADDAVVRLQVEDYQKHLDEVIIAYRFCVRASALELDDGSSDPELILDRAQRRCEDEYRTVHRTASLLNSIDRIANLRAESKQAALESLRAARAS